MRNARNSIVMLTILSAMAGPADAADEERAARQAELDAACEAAREEKLAPMRAQYVEECVEKEQRPDRASCERFYADYGARTDNQAALFYDLPACVTAHEYRTSYRNPAN